jgi:hypothetical protein
VSAAEVEQSVAAVADMRDVGTEPEATDAEVAAIV